MLDEDNEANTVTGLDDALETGGSMEMVQNRSSFPAAASEQRSRSPTKARTGPAVDAGPRGSGGTPTSIDHNFTLGDHSSLMPGTWGAEKQDLKADRRAFRPCCWIGCRLY